LFFVATRLVKMEAGLGNQLSQSMMAWIQNFTMTQWFTLLRHPVPYAYDNPSLLVAGYWSLNYEEQFYIVIGLILFGAIYFRKSMFVGIVGLMVPALAWNLKYPTISYGFFLEYWIAFALGCLVYYRLCKASSLGVRAAIDLTLAAFLIGSTFRGGPFQSSGPRLVYSEWIVTSAFALVLVYARSWDTKFKESRLGLLLCGFGLISYSLYLTHQCLLHASAMVASRLMRLGLPNLLELPIRAAIICTVGAIFWYFCERPFLNSPLPNRSAARPRT
jgi:peptidoglycan/LPS O-acetylase OafA/YrhL